jgi:hypothetical protein
VLFVVWRHGASRGCLDKRRPGGIMSMAEDPWTVKEPPSTVRPADALATARRLTSIDSFRCG